MKAGWTLAALFMVLACISRISHSQNTTNTLGVTVKNISTVSGSVQEPDHYGNAIQALAIDDYLENHILFSRGSTIYTMNMDTNRIDLIAGNGSWGYAEGVGAEAKFKTISAIVTGPGNAESQLVSDLHLPCIRSIDRKTNETSQSIGYCQNKQYSEIPGPISVMVQNLSNPYQYLVKVEGYYTLFYITYINDSFAIVNELAQWNYISYINTHDIHLEGQSAYLLENYALWSLEVTNVTTIANAADLAIWRYENFTATKMLFLEKDLVALLDLSTNGLLLMKLNNTYSIVCSDLIPDGNCSISRPTNIIRHPKDKSTLLIGGSDLYAVTLEGLEEVAEVDENSSEGGSGEPENTTSGAESENSKIQNLKDKLSSNRKPLLYSLIGGGVAIALVAVIVVVVIKKRRSNEAIAKIQSAMTNSDKSLEEKENRVKGKKDPSKTSKVAEGKGSQMKQVGGTSKTGSKVKGEASLSSAIMELIKEPVVEEKKPVKAKKPKKKAKKNNSPKS